MADPRTRRGGDPDFGVLPAAPQRPAPGALLLCQARRNPDPGGGEAMSDLNTRDLSQLPDLTVALVQTTLAWHDPAANFAHFETLLEQARGAHLIVLPEMFTTGFSMDSETLAEPEQGAAYAWLREQAKRLDAVVTGSVIIQAADGSHRNRLLWG